ncbi:elongator complex protein 4 isoform 2-T2 [Rhinophrynus dorsalis]
MAAPDNRGVSGRENATGMETSFKRKVRGKLPAISGTRPSLHNGQLLVSSGVPSLDHILGGGLAVGSLLLIEEDKYNTYSHLLLKYFLAEGVVNGHEVFVASASDDPTKILQGLPAPLNDEIPKHERTKEAPGSAEDSPEMMKIAWRYQNMPKMERRPKNILRIGIESLGSVLWGDDICTDELPQIPHSLTRFLYALRGLLRTSLSVCVITMPTHLIQNNAITNRVRKLSDTVVGLESFIGSDRGANPLYKDYHGLIHVHQIPRLNCLISDVPDSKDLAFKLKRKLFSIERLHLPPDLSDRVSRSSKQDLAGSVKLLSSGCGATAAGEKHLDF